MNQASTAFVRGKRFVWLLGGALALGLLYAAIQAGAFVGPSTSGGTGSGAVATDAQGNLSIGISPSATSRLYVLAGPTNVYGLQIQNDTGDSLFRLSRGAAASAIFRLGTDGTFVLQNQSADAFAINAAGNVGIGTTVPAQKLHVLGSAQISGSVYTTAVGHANSASLLEVGGGGATYGGGTIRMFGGTHATTPGIISFHTGTGIGIPSETARITAAGSVGIGTDAPSQKLDVNGAIALRGQAALDSDASAVYVGDLASGDGTRALALRAGDATRAYITIGGNVGIGTVNPTSTLTVQGEIKTTSGGVRFPDGSLQSSAASAGLGGSGTANFVAKFTAGTVVGNSIIYDNGTNVGIGTGGSATAKLQIGGAAGVDGIRFPDGTLQTTAAAGGAAIPSGLIAMFDASCPSGWTRFAALDGRFPQGASAYGGTGGAASHSHTVSAAPNHSHMVTGVTTVEDAWHSHGVNFVSGDGWGGPWSSTWAAGTFDYTDSPAHRHNISGVTDPQSAPHNHGVNLAATLDGGHSHTLDTVSNLPQYLNVVFCRKN